MAYRNDSVLYVVAETKKTGNIDHVHVRRPDHSADNPRPGFVALDTIDGRPQ
jgi:hypothetical protein